MSTLQMSLFTQPIAPTIPVPNRAGLSLTESFERFHVDNPHVYQYLAQLALAQRRAGHSRGSIKQLFEVLRWQASLTTAGDGFKLNNNYHSFYARLLMANEPELAGFFETRQGMHHEHN